MITMINQSKRNDPRFWKKWKASGAVGSIDGRTIEYQIHPNIRIKGVENSDIFEVEGLRDKERPLKARIYSSQVSALELYTAESDPYKWKDSLAEMGELREGPVIGLRALIEDLEGKPRLYTNERIKKIDM